MPAPRDVNRNPLPHLRPVDGGTQVLTDAPAGASTRTAAPFGGGTILVALRVIAGEIRYRLGDATVAALATDHRLRTTDGQRFVSIDNRSGLDTHLAVWAIGGLATVEVEEFW